MDGGLGRGHRRQGAPGPRGGSRRAPSPSGLVAAAADRARGCDERRGGPLHGRADSRRGHVVAPLQGLETSSPRGRLVLGGWRSGALGPGRSRFGRRRAAGPGPPGRIPVPRWGVWAESGPPPGRFAGEAAAGAGQGRRAQRDRSGRRFLGVRRAGAGRRPGQGPASRRARGGRPRAAWEAGGGSRGGDESDAGRSRRGGPRGRTRRVPSRRRRPAGASRVAAAAAAGRRAGRRAPRPPAGPSASTVGRGGGRRRGREASAAAAPRSSPAGEVLIQLPDPLHGRRVETRQGADLDVQPPFLNSLEQLLSS